MALSPYTRAAAGSGIPFVLLFNGALFLPGAPPKASDSAAEIARRLVGDRDAIQAGMVLAGLGLICGLWFVCTVATWLGDEARHRALVQAGSAGAVVAVVLGIVGTGLFYGAAFSVARSGDLGVVRGLTDAGNATIEMSKFGLALFALAVAVALRGRRLLPRWFTGAGPVVAGLALISTAPLFAEGSFTEFGGGLDLVGAAPLVLWVLVLSVLMTWRTR